MKFLHLADLHLGKRVNGFDMLEDQRFILEQILTLCEKHGVEAVVIAGDIYDTPVPPAAACTLLDWFLTQLSARQVPVLAVSGNHDSAERLDFAALGSITFENPDMETFRGLPLAMQASRIGGSMPTVFNAANEKAVELFLKRKIRFLDIYTIIEETMNAHSVIKNPGVEEIITLEQETYRKIESRW